jgi:hypothetical protein
LDKDVLPEHRLWDYEILLIEGKKLRPQHIYSLSEKELTILREYINKNLKKGYIRLSILLARYPVLFVPKLNGKLRMCVDYR